MKEVFDMWLLSFGVKGLLFIFVLMITNILNICGSVIGGSYVLSRLFIGLEFVLMYSVFVIGGGLLYSV